MEYLKDPKIDFIGKRKIYFGISAVMLLLAVAGFVRHGGPVLGLEFTGGTMVQVGFKELPPIDQLRTTLNEDGWTGYSLQTQPVSHSVIVKIKGAETKDDVAYRLLAGLKKGYPGNVNESVDRVEFIGPVIGKKLVMDTFFAIIGSLAVILLYVAVRFKNWVWGLSGVAALAHDVFLSWGLLTLLNLETTLVVVAALLTLAGYSINDTIVIFDRVRENLRSSRKETYAEIYNRSLNETLVRTINTSVTTLLAAASLYFFGGEVIHDFSLVMTFGVIVGCYSTIGVALSLVYVIEERRRRRA